MTLDKFGENGVERSWNNHPNGELKERNWNNVW